MANPNPRSREKERIWNTHGTKEGDAGAEAHGSRNDAELPGLVRKRVEGEESGWKAARAVGPALPGSVLKAREVPEETRTVSPCSAVGT